MSDQYFDHAEGGDDGDITIVFLSVMLRDEASPAQLETFEKEGLEMAKSNESVAGMSAFEMTEEGPRAVFYFSHPYSLGDRTAMEDWLRRHPLVWWITFEEQVSHKREG